MQELSAPKKNPEEGSAEMFRSVREGVKNFFARTAGRVLLVSDRAAFPKIAFASRWERAVGVVTEGDALPLFGMPEAGGVLAVGGADVMRAARLYAAVQGVSCMLFPTESHLSGVYGAENVKLGDALFAHPLAEGEVFFDETLFSDAAEGYAALLLSRLALFERRALYRFDGGAEPKEGAFSHLMDLSACDLRDILCKNAALRRMGEEGGEGEILASHVGRFAAFEGLMRLYVAFFRNGAPRKYVVPDYEARAKAAGVPFSCVHIPTEEQFTRRALVLEGRRAEFLREIGLISAHFTQYQRVYRTLGGRGASCPISALCALPERSNGLSAVIRDFGLLEKL